LILKHKEIGNFRCPRRIFVLLWTPKIVNFCIVVVAHLNKYSFNIEAI